MTLGYLSHKLFAYKSSDENLASSTVLQNDDELTVNVVGGNKYYFKACIFVNEINSGMKFALNGTSTVTTLKAIIKIYDTVLTALGRITAYNSPVTHGHAASGSHEVLIEGTLIPATSGTLVVQWAQNTSDAGNLTVQTGSILTVERIQ